MHNINEIDVPGIWGGIECTINRVDNKFYDQLEMGGYYQNEEQLNAVLRLGIKTIRFPLLWEKQQPDCTKAIDWTWAEQQLSKLRSNDVEPIVGLLHHGSGPAFTDLLDKDFPEQFARYAGSVAKKFPWLTFYNPVNEPLTTARFSGLYGLWYPHKNNDVSFVRMLLNQLKAVVLAMKEIRKINPNAKLVQTEDLGKTYSTPLLSYQANFENERRWLTYDILTGKFDLHHPLWNYFMRLGIEKEKLEFFTAHVCVPDIIGVNHYITSERYLDEETQHYPAEKAGGNGIHRYADVEAVRVPLQVPGGLSVLLTEMWNRYQLPIAITEAHLHCTREEQMRWLKQVYDTAYDLKKEGMDIRAVTAWALLGSFGWNKLLTSFPGTYETGAFDISSGTVRQTGVANLIKDLMTKSDSSHLCNRAGWWKTDARYYAQNKISKKEVKEKPVIIIGKSGTLGQAFARLCALRNIPYFLLGRDETDICNSAQLEEMIQHYAPWAIINTAGFVDIDKAEQESDRCYRENYLGVQKLAIICERMKIKLLTFSSDQVFDGTSHKAYDEDDLPNPVNVYGNSKLLAEKFVSDINPSSLLIRTSAFFGPWDQHNFLNKMIQDVQQGLEFHADDDITVSPTYVPHLVDAALDLLIDDACGIWHLVNDGRMTWYQFACNVALQLGLNDELVIPVYNRHSKAKRPHFSALTSKKYSLMPALQTGIDQYLQHTEKLNVHLLKNTGLS